MRLISKVVVLSIATSGLVQALPRAMAQTQRTNTRPPLQREPTVVRRLPSATKYTENIRNLDKQIEIPNMPSYPGRTQYLGGKVIEVPGSNSYTMAFLAADPPTRVRDWYIQALSSYNWKETIHPTPTQVSGMAKDGSGLSVSVSETKQAPYKSHVIVMYHERVKPK